jgi:hypothetical protein
MNNLSKRRSVLVLATMFLIIALAPYLYVDGVRWWAAALSALLFITASATPLLVVLILWIWTVLRDIAVRIATDTCFFVILTPVGYLLRCIGIDFLRSGRSVEVQSYWLERQPAGPSPESMSKQV